jgi:hypothetical protein
MSSFFFSGILKEYHNVVMKDERNLLRKRSWQKIMGKRAG